MMQVEQSVDDSEATVGRTFEIFFGLMLSVVGAVFFMWAWFVVYWLSIYHFRAPVILFLIVAIFLVCSYLSFKAALKLLLRGREGSQRVFTHIDLCIAGAILFISPIFISYSLPQAMSLDDTEILGITFGPTLTYLGFKLAKQGKNKAKS